MAKLRARLAGVLMLLIGVLMLGSALTLPIPMTGRKIAVLALTAPIPLIAMAIIWAGARLTDLLFILCQCLVEIVLVPMTFLVKNITDIPAGGSGLLVPILLSAVFAGRRWHIALQVSVSVLSLSLTTAGTSGASAVLAVVPGEAFAYIASAITVRLLRELAEDGMRQAQTALRRAEAATRRAERGEITDPLTGLLNRRGFERSGTDEWQRRVEEQLPLAVLLIDIDHFKRINDTLGHAAGDQLLRNVAERLTSLLSDHDNAYRLGGEEFAMLARCHSGQAELIAEQVRVVIEAELPVTVSIGVLEVLPHDCADVVATLWQIIDRADQGLYTAKRSGRNRVVAVEVAV